MPEYIWKNAPVNTRENEWGAEDSNTAGAVRGRVFGGW